jgi:hypothetical protein
LTPTSLIALTGPPESAYCIEEGTRLHAPSCPSRSYEIPAIGVGFMGLEEDRSNEGWIDGGE